MVRSPAVEFPLDPLKAASDHHSGDSGNRNGPGEDAVPVLKALPGVQRSCACGGSCPRCSGSQAMVQAKREPGAAGASSENTSGPIPPPETLASGGHPLSPNLRDFFETRFDRDFSGVRLHTGPEAGVWNERLHARAFTFGEHIWMGGGRAPAPDFLLAHELSHVVQQKQPPPLSKSNIENTQAPALTGTEAMERDADHGAARVLAGGPPPAAGSVPPRIAKSPDQPEKQPQEPHRFWYQKGEADLLERDIKDWTGDEKVLARFLLTQWTILRNSGMAKAAVKQQILQLIKGRYEAWLRAVDKARMDKCAKDKPGTVETIRGRAQGNDPCKSWFEGDYPKAASDLHDFESYAGVVTRDEDMLPNDAVFMWVREYRNRTNPEQLKQAELAGAMIGLITLGATPGGEPVGPIPRETVQPTIEQPPVSGGTPKPSGVAPEVPTAPATPTVSPQPAGGTPAPKPVITAHAEPGHVEINEVKPPARVDTVRPATPAKGSAPAKGKRPASPPKTGKRIVVKTPAPQPESKGAAPAGKPKPVTEDRPITASPKTGPTAPEGREDVLEQPGVNVTSTPGGKPQKVKAEVGTWTHRNAELLQKDPTILKRLAKETGKTKVFNKPLPDDLVPEYQIPHPDYPAGQRPRIDRLWREGNTIYEIKPNTGSAARGEAQGRQYVEWMEKYGEPPPGGGKWKSEVIEYDQAAMESFLEGIGVLPPQPSKGGSPKGGGVKGP